MMRALAGKSCATSRAYIAGSSLRIARSPLPPKKTRSKSEIAMGLDREWWNRDVNLLHDCLSRK
jgi:hypothetical protein